MAVSGVPVEYPDAAYRAVCCALEMLEAVHRLQQQSTGVGKNFEMRVGIHSGPLVAGVVGSKKFAFDVWGNTVVLAARMESSGAAGRVNISGDTHEQIKNQFSCTHRGKVQAKNVGEVDMFFVEGRV